jgi:DNA-binding LytR/AlgR family response regulator
VKLSVNEIPVSEEEEVIVRCHDTGSELAGRIRAAVLGESTIRASKDGKIYPLKLSGICYFETVDGRSFVYTHDSVYECREKLYEFEALSEGTSLFRCSKSVVVNADMIQFVRPSLSGRFEATLTNNLRVIISRQYVGVLRRMLGL